MLSITPASGSSVPTTKAGFNSQLSDGDFVFVGDSAGIGKNYIINGSFQVAQRGTYSPSNALPANGAGYGQADRWRIWVPGLLGGGTCSRAGDCPHTDEGYALKLTGATGPAAAASSINIATRLESKDARKLKNTNVTFSIGIAQGTSYTVTANIRAYKAGAADNFTTRTSISSTTATIAASGVASSVTWTFNPGDCFNGLEIEVELPYSSGQVVASGDVFYWWEAKLEIGSSKTAFEYPSYCEELTSCQRYFEQSFVDATIPASGLTPTTKAAFVGYTITDTIWRSQQISFAVSKRVSPTLTGYAPIYGGTGSQWICYFSGYKAGTFSPTLSGVDAFMVQQGGFTGLPVNVASEGYGHWTASAEL